VGHRANRERVHAPGSLHALVSGQSEFA
jgi:hypothetical protein